MKLDSGHVTLSFNLGSGLITLTSKQDKYNDGQWHLIHVHRTGRAAKLEIDNQDVVEGESPVIKLCTQISRYMCFRAPCSR